MTKEEGGLEILDRVITGRPKLWRVLLLNDDYTPMDFVVSVLERIYKKNPSEAVQIMLKVHNEGRALCGIYPKEIAETRVALTHEEARKEGHPLKAVFEPE